jgi:AAA domain
MKILRLRVTDFAAIREADIELGRGLNVLYGSNDLGKSTLAEAIRLALLLPHESSHIDEYVPWTGGRSPVVELTFETEAQRIWRVRKEFRKGGAATLLESRDNIHFDEVERARGVDARLREILKWGIPEPGGVRGGKGLPTSFLATALLSTQAAVAAVLSKSLSGDPSGTGKERIAAALQAVAQDPLFAALLRETQARRDQAYTEKGEKKRAKGSVLKEAADRVRTTREEVEVWQKQVDESGAIETTLHELADRRDRAEEVVSAARNRLAALEDMAKQAAAVLAADREVLAARQDVERIQRIDADITSSEKKLAELAGELSSAEQAAKDAQQRMAAAQAALQAAEKDAVAAGPDSASGDTVARQALELRRVAAQQAAAEAERRIDALHAIGKLVEASVKAATEYRKLQTDANAAREGGLAAGEKERSASTELQRLDLLERALEARRADEQVDVAKGRVDEKARLEARLASATTALDEVAARRAAIAVPPAASLAAMRQLETELAGARGALNVGLTVTVVPRRPIDVKVSKDGVASAGTLEIEANASVDLTIGDVADVQIRGGRRKAQGIVRSLEQRWTDEVVPHLTAAGVDDLARLTARVAEAQALDADLTLKESELQTMRQQLASMGDPTDELRRATTARAAVGNVPVESLTPDLKTLGSDPLQTLRALRQDAAAALEAARSAAAAAATNQTLADERSRAAKESMDQASAARDAELSRFPGGLPAELAAAQSAMKGAADELKAVADELASLERVAAERKARIDAGLAMARALVKGERDALDAAAAAHTQVKTGYDREQGSLETLRQRRKLENLEAATGRLDEASKRRSALPVPSEMVTDAQVADGRSALERAQSELARIVGDMHKAHGALEQVGGAVARERLRDAVEAFTQAERHEREVEVEYDAWNLLLEQMKQADADQASNLGQVLAPAIAKNFETLTAKRYEDVRLSAHLGTEGVVVGGALRPAERMSVGTREQLSTLYRLSLAEFLGSTVVLDDQLVQSDNLRMDWFRKLLVEKSQSFQIVVFTCRQDDYLGAKAAKGKGVDRQVEGQTVRVVDLEVAIHKG